MFYVEIKQGNEVIYKSKIYPNENLESTIKNYEDCIYDANKNTMSSITLVDKDENTIIIPKNIIVNSIISFIEDTKNATKEEK